SDDAEAAAELRGGLRAARAVTTARIASAVEGQRRTQPGGDQAENDENGGRQSREPCHRAVVRRRRTSDRDAESRAEHGAGAVRDVADVPDAERGEHDAQEEPDHEELDGLRVDSAGKARIAPARGVEHRSEPVDDAGETDAGP